MFSSLLDDRIIADAVAVIGARTISLLLVHNRDDLFGRLQLADPLEELDERRAFIAPVQLARASQHVGLLCVEAGSGRRQPLKTSR
jgi:hypothetical protein